MSLQGVSLFWVIEFIKFNEGYYCSCLNNSTSQTLTGHAITAVFICFILLIYLHLSDFLELTVEGAMAAQSVLFH